MKMLSQHFPLFLAILYAVFLLITGISPSSRAVWIAEVLPIIGVYTALIVSYRHFKFSNSAYLFMSFWMFLHTIGAHYTFAEVPFEWGNKILSPWLGIVVDFF